MESIGATSSYRNEVSSYLHLAYFTSNRVNMVHLAKLLYTIPARIRCEQERILGNGEVSTMKKDAMGPVMVSNTLCHAVHI